MKASLSPCLALIASLGLAISSHAQIAGPPKLIDYQGTLLDGAGAPLDGGTAENFRIHFRIWDSQTDSGSGDLIWAEKQIVTVLNGRFSVRLGEGEPINSGTADTLPLVGNGAESVTHGDLLGAFTGSATGGERYLGLTVIPNGAGTPGEIQPRLRFLTTPYSSVAERARFAESGPAAGVFNADSVAIGTTSPLATLHVDGQAYFGGGTSSVITGNTSGPLSGSHGVLIGRTSGGTGLFADAGHLVFQPRGSTAGRHIVFFDGDGTENMRIADGGNVGIGTTTPAGLLHVFAGAGGQNVNGASDLIVEDDDGAMIQLNGGTTSSSGLIFDGGDGAKLLFEPVNDEFRFFTNGSEIFTLHSSGDATVPGDLEVGGGTTAVSVGNVDGPLVGSSKALLARTSGNGTNSPFDVAGHLVLQPRGSASRDIIFLNGDGMAENMRIADGGDVGIGTVAPANSLDVVGALATGERGQISFRDSTAELTRGYLGAGTSGVVLGVLNSQATGSNGGIHFEVSTTSATGATIFSVLPGTDGVRLNTGTYQNVSDARLKQIIGRSDAGRDLAMLASIEITDYLRKDVSEAERRPRKKVIAQQVEKVFPMAVSKSTGVVPDIYAQASIQNGWVALATDLRVGERVRLAGEFGSEDCEVLELRDGGFRVALDEDVDSVFVYGRQVDDLRSVDYDAIAMLNVSATQELHRRVKAQETELAEKTGQLAALQKRMIELEEKLASIEKLVGGKGVVSTATPDEKIR